MNLQFVTLVSVLCFMAGSAPLAAGEQKEKDLLLLDAVRIAYENHPRLRKAEYRAGAAEVRVQQARSSYFPQVDLGGGAKQGLSGSGRAFGLNGIANSPLPDDVAISANIYQDIYDFGRTKHETQARREELAFYEDAVRAEMNRVALEVTRAYYGVLKAEKMQELADQVAKEKGLKLRQAKAFRRAHLASQLEVTLAEVELSRAELESSRGRHDVDRAFAELNSHMGLEEPTTTYTLEEPSVNPQKPISLDRLMELGVRNRPDLRALGSQIEADQAWVQRAKSARYPRIMGAFSGGWARFPEIALGQLLYGGLAIKLPLFTGKELESKIDERQNLLQEHQTDRDDLVRNIRLEISAAYHDLVIAVEVVQAQERIARQASQALRLARTQYKVRLSDLIELTDAQTAHVSAQNDHAMAVYDVKVQESELRYAIGESF